MTTLPHIQYFLGANSPAGFYSLYDHLLPPEQARAIYILKGGPGCGKSTLGKLIAGILPLKQGSITIDGLDSKNKKKEQEIRNKIGIVFQNPENQIIFNLIF